MRRGKHRKLAGGSFKRQTRSGSRLGADTSAATPGPSTKAATNDAKLTPEEVHSKSVQVLELMHSLRLELGTFIHGICYGNKLSRDHPVTIRARRDFIQSETFEDTLELLYKPPRPRGGGGKLPTTGSKKLLAFSTTVMKDIYTDELKEFSRDYRVPKEQLVDADELAKITSDMLGNTMQKKCKYLYKMLASLGGDELEELTEDKTHGIRKHPHFGTIIMVTSLAYRRNHLKNTLPYVLGFYMHAKHTSKAVFDLLHQAGISVGYETVLGAVDKISEERRVKAIKVAKTQPKIFVHDNILFKYPVQSQQGNNQSVTDNGTAISMIGLSKEAAAAFHDVDNHGPFLRQLKAKRVAGTASRLSWGDINKIECLQRVQCDYIFDILDFLRMVPGLEKSEVLQAECLKCPIGPQQLPHGKEWITEAYMLPTVDLEEMTYSGNSQVLPFVLKYLELTEGEARDKMVIEELIPWIGDQTTVHRCRMLQSFRNEDWNGLDRFEPFLFMFGAFHCEMALAAGTFENSRGESDGSTFAHDTILLSHTGLNHNMNKKHPDFHTVDEFLLHQAEARFCGLFLALTGSATDEELIAWVESHHGSPEEILNVAKKIFQEHASSGALYRLSHSKSTDEVRSTTIIQNSDLLCYYAYCVANKHGHVDRIEDLLPELLVFFAGSGNGNYAQEMYEFLQLLTHECTPEIKKAILRNCLLVNMQGQPDSFFPIDQLQEHHNAGIRDYGPPPQNASWEQYKKISPAIPFYLSVVKHVDEHVSGFKHTHIHKDPKHEADVQALIRSHHGQKIHIEVPDHKLDSKNKSLDCVTTGSLALKGNKLNEYAEKCEQFFSAISDEMVYTDEDTPSNTLLKVAERICNTQEQETLRSILYYYT